MIWNKALRTQLFADLAAIDEIRYLSMDFGQVDDSYLSEETPHPPIITPAILLSDIREERTSSDKDLDRYQLTFTVRLLIDDARFATATAPQEHFAAYDNALALSERIITLLLSLNPRMTLESRSEAQLRDSLRQYNLSFSLTSNF
ncbi:hypothetical protein [Porphyromonas sp.]|uniref:hypothetical protein n=1 Tax=Porphyromonas sp. TaxID=1924944 RepID=UPI003AAA4AA9